MGTSWIPYAPARRDLSHQIDAGGVVRPKLDGDIRKGDGGTVVNDGEQMIDRV